MQRHDHRHPRRQRRRVGGREEDVGAVAPQRRRQPHLLPPGPAAAGHDADLQGKSRRNAEGGGDSGRGREAEDGSREVEKELVLGRCRQRRPGGEQVREEAPHAGRAAAKLPAVDARAPRHRPLRPALQRIAVRDERQLGRAPPRKVARPRQAPLREPLGEPGLTQHALHAAADRAALVRIDQHGRAPAHLGQGPAVGGHHRDAERHRLDDRQAEPLVEGGQHQQPGPFEERAPLAVGDVAPVLDPPGQRRPLRSPRATSPPPACAGRPGRAAAPLATASRARRTRRAAPARSCAARASPGTTSTARAGSRQPRSRRAPSQVLPGGTRPRQPGPVAAARPPAASRAPTARSRRRRRARHDGRTRDSRAGSPRASVRGAGESRGRGP